MGHGSGAPFGRTTGFRANSNASGAHNTAAEWAGYPAALAAAVKRLRGVVIEQDAALKVMERCDRADTLHYVDPPYVAATRNPGNPYDRKHRYRHELSDADHSELLEAVRGLAGMVVLSGYPSALYDDALSGWLRVETRALADAALERIEVLWINPHAAARLDHVKSGHGSPLFAEAAHG
jgi:DNA adenine methylase